MGAGTGEGSSIPFKEKDSHHRVGVGGGGSVQQREEMMVMKCQTS